MNFLQIIFAMILMGSTATQQSRSASWFPFSEPSETGNTTWSLLKSIENLLGTGQGGLSQSSLQSLLQSSNFTPTQSRNVIDSFQEIDRCISKSVLSFIPIVKSVIQVILDGAECLLRLVFGRSRREAKFFDVEKLNPNLRDFMKNAQNRIKRTEIDESDSLFKVIVSSVWNSTKLLFSILLPILISPSFYHILALLAAPIVRFIDFIISKLN